MEPQSTKPPSCPDMHYPFTAYFIKAQNSRGWHGIHYIWKGMYQAVTITQGCIKQSPLRTIRLPLLILVPGVIQQTNSTFWYCSLANCLLATRATIVEHCGLTRPQSRPQLLSASIWLLILYLSRICISKRHQRLIASGSTEANRKKPDSLIYCRAWLHRNTQSTDNLIRVSTSVPVVLLAACNTTTTILMFIHPKMTTWDTCWLQLYATIANTNQSSGTRFALLRNFGANRAPLLSKVQLCRKAFRGKAAWKKFEWSFRMV